MKNISQLEQNIPGVIYGCGNCVWAVFGEDISITHEQDHYVIWTDHGRNRQVVNVWWQVLDAISPY